MGADALYMEMVIGVESFGIGKRERRLEIGTQSPRPAGCLRIGLEPTKSASGDAVSKTSVPAASA
jgi:hypothetical protein